MSMEGDLKAAIAATPEKSLAAKLRKLMPDIERQLRGGASHEAIVEALKKGGITLSLITFRTNLYRWRKAMEKPGAAAQPQRQVAAAQQSPAGAANATAAGEPQESQARRIENKGDIVRLRQETNYDMEELARLGKNQE